MKRMKFATGAWSCARMLCVTTAMLATTMAAQAQNAIQAVKAVRQGGMEAVQVDFAQPLTELPKTFSVQNPPRISLDFPGVVNSTGQSSLTFNQGNLASANVVQAAERSRIVLNLKQNTNYRAELRGSSLMVYLQNAPSTVSAPTSLFAEPIAPTSQALIDIDFRRGVDNAGRVLVELPSNQVGVDIKPQGQNLVVDFLKTSLPPQLRKRLDVNDFATPVSTITTTQVGDRVRMVIEPKGAWEHSAYQTDTHFVVEVRAQKADPNKLVQGKGYRGEKLSLNFQNIEIRSLLQVIADFTNFNVVTSDSVTGSVTLRLKDVPWDQALEIILQARDLGMKKSGNVLLIAPKAELATKAKQELEDQAALQTLEPVRTQAFQLNYAKAADIAAQLMSSGGAMGAGVASARLISSRGSVVTEPRTNQLFVTDVPSRLDQIQAMLAKLDVPVRQVMIEARIVEASDGFSKSLGVRLGGGDFRGVQGGSAGYSLTGGSRVALGGTYDAVTATTGQTSGSPLANFVNLPSAGAGGSSPAAFAISLFSAGANRFLNLELSALESDNKGRIVSSPRVVTADQTKAIVEQGTELPYQTATSSGATAIQFRKASLKLEVTPQITPEGAIILDLEVNKDSPGAVTAAGVAIDTKHIKTQVLVENGGTVVIGGIYGMTESEIVTKVPLLGDIPYLGNLFKKRDNNTNKTELLVFITPKVITDRR